MQSKPRLKLLKPEEVRRHPELQPRVSIDPAVVAEYRDAIIDGAKMPPITTFFDGVYYYLADGWHRYEAYCAAKAVHMNADVYEGTFRDAKLYALGANSNHGLRRTNEDKRRAVGMLLLDAEWSTWSDRDIAKACRVSQPFVLKIRTSSFASDNSDHWSLTNVISDNEDSAPEDACRVAPPPPVSEEVREKADGIRAAGGEPRFYKNKHGSVGVMDVSNVGRKRSDAKPSLQNQGDTQSESASFRDDTIEDSSEEFGPSAAEIAALAEMERLDQEKLDQLYEIAHSDDKLSAALKTIETQAAEIRRQKAEIDVLRERQTGLMNEKVALESAAKRWRRIAEQHGYSDKVAK